MIKAKNPLILAVGIILCTSLVLILPQFFGRGILLGSDSIFHFNRFYDTAQQIKNHNIQYFTSFYGFDQTGRIVNAFYGPLTAYLHGFLVLISGSWFHYQLLSNYLLYAISGCAMFYLLSKNSVRISVSVPISLIYMMTYAIQYWIFRQGFTSWGASILPLCLLPLKNWVQKKDMNSLQVALLMGMMFQTHLFSSLLLLMIYIFFYIYAFLTGNTKILLLKKLSLAIGIFLILTVNIWLGFLELYRGNRILAPFLNHQMAENTITANSSYWLITPYLFLGILLFQTGYLLMHSKRAGALNKGVTYVALFFTFLASNLFPWHLLERVQASIIELIQFPFRFFVPAIALFLFGFALTLQENFAKEVVPRVFLKVTVGVSLFQILLLTGNVVKNWQLEPATYDAGGEAFSTQTNQNKIKATFFQHDLAKSLAYLKKATPDYLPVYAKMTEDSYTSYKQALLINSKFKKSVHHNQLSVEWHSKSTKKTEIPVVKYANTMLFLNGKRLTSENIELTEVGVVRLKPAIGENKLVLSYSKTSEFKSIFFCTLAGWVFFLGNYFLEMFRRKV